MIAPGSPTVRRRRLATGPCRLRKSSGKTREAVVAALKWSPSKISRYERAKTYAALPEGAAIVPMVGMDGSHLRRDVSADRAGTCWQSGRELRTGMQRPTELEPSERYKASRNTIRDAIKWLTVHGLVRTQSRTKVISRHHEHFIDGTPWSLQTTSYPLDLIARGAGRLITIAYIP